MEPHAPAPCLVIGKARYSALSVCRARQFSQDPKKYSTCAYIHARSACAPDNDLRHRFRGERRSCAPRRAPVAHVTTKQANQPIANALGVVGRAVEGDAAG